MKHIELLKYISINSNKPYEEVEEIILNIPNKRRGMIKEIFDKFGIVGLNILSDIGEEELKNIDILDIYNLYGKTGAEIFIYLENNTGDKQYDHKEE